MAKPTHDLAIKTGEYVDNRTGQNKGRWLRVGTVIRHDDGGTSIKLDCVPVGLPAWDGWASVFNREDSFQDAYPPPYPASTKPVQTEPDFDDDILF